MDRSLCESMYCHTDWQAPDKVMAVVIYLSERKRGVNMLTQVLLPTYTCMHRTPRRTRFQRRWLHNATPFQRARITINIPTSWLVIGANREKPPPARQGSWHRLPAAAATRKD